MLSDFLNQSLWLDEATSVLVARDFSFSKILTVFSPGDFHPPLYYILLKIWIGIFGSSEISARSLSMGFSIFSVGLIYLIADKLFNRFVAIGSATLLATSPLLFYYSFEARMYSMSVFASLLTVFFFVRVVYEQKRIINWVGFMLSAVMLTYTDYLPVLTLVFCFAYLVFDKKVLTAYKYRWATVLGVIVIFYLPWLPVFLSQLQVGNAVRENAPLWWEALGKTNLKQLILVPVKFLIGRISFDNKWIYFVVVAIFAFQFGVSLLNSIKKYKESLLVWFWLLIPFICTLIFGAIMSGFSFFRLLFLLPPFYLLVAYGLYHMEQRRVNLLYRVGLNIFACSYLVFVPSLWREDWRGAVKYVESNSNKNAIAVFVTNNQRDSYKYYSKVLHSTGPGGLDSNLPDKIWFFRYVQPIFDSEEKVRTKIERLGYIKQAEHDFNGIVVWEYKKNADFN